MGNTRLFRAELFRFLKKEGKIKDELVNKLIKWRHSGFSIDNGKRIEKDDREGTEAIAQYMMRNVFSTENIRYVEKTGKVIYRSGKMQGKDKHHENRKNFSVYDAEEFIAAIQAFPISVKGNALSPNIFQRNRSRQYVTTAATQIRRGECRPKRKTC